MKSGEKYVGTYKYDLKDGRGVHTFPERGFKYTGEFEANKKHGYGKLYYKGKLLIAG